MAMGATMMKKALIVIVAFWALPLKARVSSDMAVEVPSSEMQDAYQHYWREFDRYESKRLREEKDKYQKNWNEIKNNFEKNDGKLSEEQRKSLKASIEKYREHLKRFGDADTRPASLLNLAQAQLKLSELEAEGGHEAINSLQMEAVRNLQEIERSFPTFVHLDQALYLHALTLDAIGQEKSALGVWEKLSALKVNSLFTAHGNLALGDQKFRQEVPAAALIYYKKALAILNQTDVPKKDYEQLRVQYRIAWAAYRSANLKACIETAFSLLAPGRDAKKRDFYRKVENDAVELIGDALFEKNDIFYTKSSLKRREISPYATAVALRVMNQYVFHNMHERALEIGQVVLEDYPLAKDTPDFMMTMAEAYKKSGSDDQWLASLERVAILLPKDSLWRNRMKDQYEAVKHMESVAFGAAKTLAAWNYEKGLATGSVARFDNADTFYGILVKFSPNHADAMQWRIRQANCSFFAGRLPKADERYAYLKEKMKLTDSDLTVVAYQLALTREKIWNESLLKVSMQGKNETEAPAENLKRLEASVEDYANRFPMDNKTVDLLLVAAGANRDSENLPRATQYWQRALVSDPTPGQRAIAIRGMVLTKVNHGTSRDVMDLAMRYLKLEDWSALGSSLGKELKGVLTSAAKTEGDRLNKEGNVLESGAMLVDIAQDFPDIPERNKIYRDGAYLLALGGDWTGAKKAANAFLDEGRTTETSGDMIYLKGRADEFQMRFRPAVESYLTLSEQFPKHSRVEASLQRAESLAVTDDNLKLAGKAAEKSGDTIENSAKRVEAYKRANDHYTKSDDHLGALRVAQKMAKYQKSPEDRFDSRLRMARAKFSLKKESEALKEFEKIGADIEKERGRLDTNVYQAIAGEVFYRLGDEAQQRFDDFKLMKRSGGIKANIDTKAKYLDDLMKYYEKAVKSGHASYAEKARNRISVAAQSFAEEISEILTLKHDQISRQEKEKFASVVDRLTSMSETYRGANALAGVVKERRSGAKDKRKDRKQDSQVQGQKESAEVLPEAVGTNLPAQWNY